ncbi:virulence factor TspB C-terminal domain-related protein [Pseudoxanthomonas winnipegensis]|uniref:virulence factor TspB C-terminal domain-related protein n=1 Tax=Pseudoxanthomonas winnipegensis TaxID=2480810 RepID=UPI00102DFA78|nr:virulence factor TspB C-terminal domain-related protein [Pseudoxanthomonas winnipegensis]TAA08850.1 hypothetical protein EA659_13445 [Pseudoxanthomonas winnipegensis]TAH71796.1 hypothetical protein EA657_11780 [Pseudoxanthomonas winnipegensis]
MIRFLLLAVVVLVVGFSPAAYAQDKTRGEAYSACVSNANSVVAGSSGTLRIPSGGACLVNEWGNRYLCSLDQTFDGGTTWAARNAGCGDEFFSPCPATAPWDETSHTCKVNNCANAVQLTNTAFVGQAGSPLPCSGGCEYKADSNIGPAVELTSSITVFRGGSNWKPTGNTCTVDNEQTPYDPKRQTCVATGGNYMECARPDGSHCVTVNGRTLCWNNAETGPKITADGKVAADREKAPTQPTPPKAQVDPQVVNQSTTTINGNTYNTNTYSGSGNAGGQPNTGTGSSNGESPAPGDKDDGDKGSVSGGGDCTAAPACSGDVVECAVLYQQWLTRCNRGEGIEGDGTTEAENALNDRTGEGDPDFTPFGGGPNGAIWPASHAAEWQETIKEEDVASKLDATGLGLQRTCPIATDARVGQSVLSISFAPICDLLIKFSNLVVALGYMLGIRIMLGSKKA